MARFYNQTTVCNLVAVFSATGTPASTRIPAQPTVAPATVAVPTRSPPTVAPTAVPPTPPALPVASPSPHPTDGGTPMPTSQLATRETQIRVIIGDIVLTGR